MSAVADGLAPTLAELVDVPLVAELVQAVWSSFVDAEAELFEVPEGPGAVQDALVGRIEIAGATPAVVRLVLSRAAAREAAARMLELAPAEVEDADVLDATGELTNMIGGNLKAVLLEEHRLGLPQVGVAPPLIAAGLVVAPLVWGAHLVVVLVDPVAPAVPAPRTEPQGRSS